MSTIEDIPMKWSESYATGIERIDEQHKMLFKMSEDFRAALDGGRGDRVYGTLLQSLAAYSQGHFGFEEGCMDRCRCPKAQANRNDHARFVSLLAEFQRRFEQRGFDRSDAYSLVEDVDQWLVDHIGSIDVSLREFSRPG